MSEQDKLQQYFLTMENGLSVTILNVGATVQSIKVPYKGRQAEMVLGYLRPQEYVTDNFHMGAIAGRFANRIANGQFSLGANDYQLPTNCGDHHLHGGPNGFNRKIWHLVERFNDNEPGVKLECTSIDGEEGYPGNVTASATYRIVDGRKLVLDIEASSDQPTPINLTGHAYFNLNEGSGLIDNHLLQVNANRYLTTDVNCIPTGEYKTVVSSDLDFSEATELKGRIDSSYAPIRAQKGIDHNFIINDYNQQTKLAATVLSPQSGVQMRIYTNMPGLQVYTGNHLTTPFQPYQGLCLEPQFFPDSPNHPEFPNCILSPGETYHHQIVYEFIW
ncbi:galactose mutarotase [Aliikangiella marina]|uniref:Aldose 1-epimerase n=1 Tax=Aliikangiella marina TaxID=1712262 RepID=A0A545T987_9GAMM|nr:aldose epimerase family protein [Aliikangiella marina]TQV73769.1 galactose mutarotase [Aliikangiella marina]